MWWGDRSPPCWWLADKVHQFLVSLHEFLADALGFFDGVVQFVGAVLELLGHVISQVFAVGNLGGDVEDVQVFGLGAARLDEVDGVVVQERVVGGGGGVCPDADVVLT